jgi:hypothetical protein
MNSNDNLNAPGSGRATLRRSDNLITSADMPLGVAGFPLIGEAVGRSSDNAILKEALDADFFLSQICPQ